MEGNRHLSGQEINVYGTGVNALKFVLLNNKDIKVKAFIEGKKSEIKKFIPNAFPEPIPVVRFESAGTLLNQYYTVVASSENAYWEIKDRLENEYGLVEYENFEYYTTYRKKIAIIYGNCHTGMIKRALTYSKEFNSVYGFYPLKEIQNLKLRGGV